MPTCKIAASDLVSRFYKEEWIKSFDATLGKHLLIAFELIKLVFNNLVFIPLGMLSPKTTMFCSFDVKDSL